MADTLSSAMDSNISEDNRHISEKLFHNVAEACTNCTDDFYFNETLLVETSYDRRQFNMPLIVTLFFIWILGLFGNILVMLVYNYSSKKSAANIFVLALAAVDIINCLFCIPFHIDRLWNPYLKVVAALCITERFFESCSNLASGFCIVAIAAERYSKIRYPLIPFSCRKAKSILLVICVLTLLLSWPQIVCNKIGIIKVGKHQVASEKCGTDNIYLFIVHCFLFITYIIAVCAFLFFYSSILFVIVKRRILLREQLKIKTTEKTVQKHRDLTPYSVYRVGSVSGIKMRSRNTTVCLTTVSVTVFLGYFPFLIIMMLTTSGIYLQRTFSSTGDYFHFGTSSAVDLACGFGIRSHLLNCALNPVIYSILNPSFRSSIITGFKETASRAQRKLSSTFSSSRLIPRTS